MTRSRTLWKMYVLCALVLIPALTTVALISLKSNGPSSEKGLHDGRSLSREALDPVYDFTVLYAILYDDAHGSVPARGVYARRLKLLEGVMERESLGKIQISPKLDFVHVSELGDDRLDYSTRTAYGWIADLEEYYAGKGVSYDILIFCPASQEYAPWCTDAPSIGYNHNDRKYVCLETFLDPSKQEEDVPAIALTIHKIFHGFGYNHISQENRPMNLLQWNIGLPKTQILPLASWGEGHRIIFDQHIMKVLGFLPRNEFEKQCRDNNGFVCAGRGGYFCENSYDVSCIDSDQDGIVDSEDDYLFTPYGASHQADTDLDGIPDSLDLCEGKPIEVHANIELRKATGIVDQDPIMIRIEPGPAIRGVEICEARSINGFIRFPRAGVKRVDGNELALDAKSLSGITRLLIHYESREGFFYRPFYLYKRPQQIEYVHEKEWYYFSRFGCDIPDGVDLDDHATYDKNLDGLPDRDRFRFANGITNRYDWDADGVPDVEDNLPTVHGTCRNGSVKGVPDSDGDGLCDPALFTFSEMPGLSEGDLTIQFREDLYADACPYVYGMGEGGCP